MITTNKLNRVTFFDNLNPDKVFDSFGNFSRNKCNKTGKKKTVNTAEPPNVKSAINPKFCNTTEWVNNKAASAAIVVKLPINKGPLIDLTVSIKLPVCL